VAAQSLTPGLSPKADRRLTVVAAAAASVLSFAEGLPHALHYVFWADEFASWRVIIEPNISEALGRIVRRESTPPAWYLLAWALHRADVSIHGLRVLSAIFAATLAGLSVPYARRFVSLPAAALVGLLVAVGGEFMRHNWELRAYAMFSLLCLLFAITLEWVSRSASTRRLAVFVVVVAVGSMTHYFFLFTLFAGLVWLWITPAVKSVRKRMTAAAALGLIPLIVWSPWFVHQTRADHTRRLGRFAVKKVELSFPRLLATGYPGVTAVDVAVVVLAVVGVILLFRRGGRASLCALLAISPLVCSAVLSYGGVHLLDYRNLIGSAPFVAVAVVVALDAIPLRPLALTAIAVVFALAVYGAVVAGPGPHRRHPAKKQPPLTAGSAEVRWFPTRSG
jgi:hypothetical protein